MSSTITLSMVKSFKIDDLCFETFPCKHNCKITLVNGVKAKTKLNGVDIYTLANAVGKDRIKGHFCDHLNSYKDFSFRYGDLSTPEKILSEVFARKISASAA